ncbi:MAG: hypothetical protein RR867_08095 [Ruthenibacterium sp.]
MDPKLTLSKKTYYGLGIVAAALTILGGLCLMFGTYAALLYNIASLLTGGMLLFLAATQREDKLRRTCYLIATLCVIAGMVPGVIGKIGGALAWPVFAIPYFKQTEETAIIHTASFLVILCGLAQFVGSFLPMTRMIAACVSIGIAAAQGMLVWLLFHDKGSIA